MTANINPTLFASQFKAALEPALQQKGSRLRGAVTVGPNISGAKKAVEIDRIEAIATRPVTGQLQPKVFTHANTSRRWVLPVSRSASQPIDHFDKLKTLQDPASVHILNAIAAHGRDFDDEILTAMFADAKTGEEGASTTSFTAGNVIAMDFAAGGNTRLTVAKLREAKRILMANNNDFVNDQAYVAITAKEHDSMLAEAQAINLDYTDKPVLVEGLITRFLGFNFIHTEQLVLDPTATWRRVPVWMKSGVGFRLWEDIVTTVNKRTDIEGEPWEAYSMATYGATRTDEKRVVEIKSTP